MSLPVYLILIAVISLITFLLYATDKHRAKKHAWRISEKALLFFSFLGGAPGGLAGIYVLRHKTRHWYFPVINLLGLLWQAAVAVLLAIY